MNSKGQKLKRIKRISVFTSGISGIALLVFAFTAPSTIDDLFFPGSQEGESGRFESPDRCRTCHGNYNTEIEPYFNWSGSMMAQAARDPLYEASLAITNQDVPEGGDLCIRCHSPEGWLEGRSIPTDGSALTQADREGVHCDFCHRLVKPSSPGTNAFPHDQIYTENTWPSDNSYLESIDSLPPLSGNGMYIVDSDNAKRGPLVDAGSKHAYHYSPFHSESALCGTCHDVSNPLYDRQIDGTYILNDFGSSAPSYNTYDLFPLERTYSEWLMSEYNTPFGVYAPQFGGNKAHVYTCQDCHMKDVSGLAANKKEARFRNDLPHHDMTGGNTFIPGIIADLYPSDVSAVALDSGVSRARNMLQLAASMDLMLSEMEDHFSATVRVSNETGHKLPTGYPEGRRIWINIVAKDASGLVIYESGHYDYNTGTLIQDADAKIYEIKPGIDNSLAGITELSEGPSFHFILNNKIFSDNRIPPRGFTNAAFAYIQSPPVNYTYADGQYWDDSNYILPITTDSIEVTLFYQSLSKEYVEFLREENVTNESGNIIYNLWDSNGKSAPVTMKKISISALQDSDGDGIKDSRDNCPATPNADQIDEDQDGAGAPCDCDDRNSSIIEGYLFFIDNDRDGHGNSDISIRACTVPPGYVSDNADCDDNNQNRYPGAPAMADGLDNDCDGIIDRVSQTVDFASIPDQLSDIGQITLNATASSGLPVSYFLEAGNADIVGNSLYVNGAGYVSITAIQRGNDSYLPADPVNQSFCINPLKPAISLTITKGQAVLISSSAVNNLWFFNGELIPDAINDTLYPDLTGTYSVQVQTDQCLSEISEEFHFTNTALSTTTEDNIHVFPNPSQGKFTLSLPESLSGSKLQLSIVDISGRSIISSMDLPLNSGEKRIDVSYLAPGVYTFFIINQANKRVYRGQIIRK